ncbi:COG4 transport protein-domain-containing protein [Apiospora kogelbergensis]|uniref:COG4 transport protein-domain-containing protein n=1 Tax=Apiospora kogelbergensis TaxID=1337665 RepID=UPI00312E724C
MSATNHLNGDSPSTTAGAPTTRRLSIHHHTNSKPLISDAQSPEDVRASLAALHMRETALTSRLQSLFSSQADLARELGRLDLLRANLGSQVIATRSVSNGMLASAAETAGRLSNRVKELDLEKDRVQQTLQVVEQVAELKACVHGVVGSMGAPQDWEAAAGYISRASKVPESVIKGGFAAAIVPSVEVPDAPWVTLENAKESLCGLFLREFEKAAQEGDGAKVTRFFKLFPLIGRADVGLDVYGRYVCTGVAGTARQTWKLVPGAAGQKDGFLYANALTKLFEHIAQIVEGHGGLVERHYGEGKMVKVIERLQMEVDVQGGIILDSWSDERTVERKLTDVKSYPFSFLVQSFLPPQKGLTGTPRMNSPALGGGTNPRESEDEGVNMKEVDALLNEIALMLGRWSLYTRFLAGKCKVSLCGAFTNDDFTNKPQMPGPEEDAALSIPDALLKSNLLRKVSDKLVTPYDILSTFYFRRSVEKAFQLDETPSGLTLNINKPVGTDPPYIISAVDDVMYIVSTVIQKSISTSQRDVVGHVIPTIGRVLGSDFIGMVQRRMRDESYPKPVIQGGFPPEDKIVSFIVLINTLDVATEYLSRIITQCLGSSEEASRPAQSSPITNSFPFEHDAAFVTSALTTLNASFSTKASELLSDGLQVLLNMVIKQRIRPIILDTFRDADYTLTEDELAEIAQQNDEDEEEMLDQAQRRFEHGWTALMKPVERLMTPKTFSTLMMSTAKHLAVVLEKRIWSSSGRVNAFGAIRMERDFSGMVRVVAKGNYTVREAFARVTQMLMVANMEDDEWDEITAEGDDDGIQWVLTEEERRKARNLVR